MAKKSKIAVKKWGLGDKKWVNGLGKLWGGDQTRKAKWCKMQVKFLKTDKTKGTKDKK